MALLKNAAQPVTEFWDQFYQKFDPTAEVEGSLELPAGAPAVAGKKLLIVACGTGKEVVRACRDGALVTALDISSQAVKNARDMVQYNNLTADFVVADAGQTGLPDGSIDVIWGSAVFHHLDHESTAREFARILKPGGQVYMLSEPTFFNPLLKWAYETAFGKGRVGRRRKFLFFVRRGDDFEKPIERSDLEVWKKYFRLLEISRGFMFFEKLGHVLSRRGSFHKAFSRLDRMALRLIPGLNRYGYEYDFILNRK